MRRTIRSGVLLLIQVALIVAPAGAQTAGEASKQVPAEHAGNASKDVPATTPLGSGPYPAIMEVDPSLPTHTLYHPEDLAASGQLPVVVWGNGACWNVGNAFRWFLSDISSYGYFVIAVGPIGERPMPIPTPPMTPQPPGTATLAGVAKLPPPASHSSQLIDAMNWAIAANERLSSNNSSSCLIKTPCAKTCSNPAR